MEHTPFENDTPRRLLWQKMVDSGRYTREGAEQLISRIALWDPVQFPVEKQIESIEAMMKWEIIVEGYWRKAKPILFVLAYFTVLFLIKNYVIDAYRDEA